MDPARDFLSPRAQTGPAAAAGPAGPRRGARWVALAKGVGFVALLVTACSPLWGLAVFFGLH
jgi:hypothetical protein